MSNLLSTTLSGTKRNRLIVESCTDCIAFVATDSRIRCSCSRLFFRHLKHNSMLRLTLTDEQLSRTGVRKSMCLIAADTTLFPVAVSNGVTFELFETDLMKKEVLTQVQSLLSLLSDIQPKGEPAPTVICQDIGISERVIGGFVSYMTDTLKTAGGSLSICVSEVFQSERYSSLGVALHSLGLNTKEEDNSKLFERIITLLPALKTETNWLCVEVLREIAPDYKFLRGLRVGNVEVNFYCEKLKLAIIWRRGKNYISGADGCIPAGYHAQRAIDNREESICLKNGVSLLILNGNMSEDDIRTNIQFYLNMRK